MKICSDEQIENIDLDFDLNIELEDIKISNLVRIIRTYGVYGLTYVENLLRRAIMNKDIKAQNRIRRAIEQEKIISIKIFMETVKNGTHLSYLDSMTPEAIDWLSRDFIYIITKSEGPDMYKYDRYYAILVAYMKDNKKLTMQTKREG